MTPPKDRVQLPESVRDAVQDCASGNGCMGRPLSMSYRLNSGFSHSNQQMPQPANMGWAKIAEQQNNVTASPAMSPAQSRDPALRL